MKMSATTVQRGLFGMFAGGLLAFGYGAIVAPVADAQPVPGTETDNCSVSAIADTSRAVSESTSTYLASNPAADDALSTDRDEVAAEVTEGFRAYFAQNPKVETDLMTINQPAIDLASQCGVEVAPTRSPRR